MTRSIHPHRLSPAVQASRMGAAPAWAWPAFLLATSLAGDLVFACATPFAAFAVVAAWTLALPSALLLMTAIWLGNQAVGFGVLGYPAEGVTLLWGAAIAAAALIATLAVSFTLRRLSEAASMLRLGAVFAAAYASYESVLFIASLSLGGQEAFRLPIVAEVAGVNAVWLAGLVVASEAWRHASGGFGVSTERAV